MSVLERWEDMVCFSCVVGRSWGGAVGGRLSVCEEWWYCRGRDWGCWWVGDGGEAVYVGY